MSNFNNRVSMIPHLPAEKWEVCIDPRFDQYAISNKGRVWDLIIMKERELYGVNHCPTVQLYNQIDGRYTTRSVNRLVMAQFNSNVTLNRNDKLVYVYKKATGVISNSEASAVSFDNRFTEEEVNEICRDIVMGISLSKIAEQHNTYRSRIQSIKSNRAYREISKKYW